MLPHKKYLKYKIKTLQSILKHGICKVYGVPLEHYEVDAIKNRINELQEVMYDSKRNT